MPIILNQNSKEKLLRSLQSSGKTLMNSKPEEKEVNRIALPTIEREQTNQKPVAKKVQSASSYFNSLLSSQDVDDELDLSEDMSFGSMLYNQYSDESISSISNSVTNKENDDEEKELSQALFTELKESIRSIPCDMLEIDSAISKMCNVLDRASDKRYTDHMTVDQILIIISLLLDKIDDFNKISYSDLTVEPFKQMLQEGEVKYKKEEVPTQGFYTFLEELLTSYVSYVGEEFNNKLKVFNEKDMEQFITFQTKKLAILEDFLKWILAGKGE